MSELKEVKLEKIILSKTNPRKEFNKNSLQELAESIATNGLINPVTLRKKGSNYELVSGERRFRAVKLNKAKSILGMIRTLTDEQVLEIQYIENLQRQDVHPLDEAKFISGMLETGKFTIETIADKIGKPRAYVAGRLQLTKLIPDAHKAYAKGEIELGHALLLCKLQPADQQKLFDDELENMQYQYVTVADLKQTIQNLMLNLNEAPFSVKDKLLLETAGSCEFCPKRTGNALDLFSEFSGKSICTDPACYNEKVQLEIERKMSKADQEGKSMVKLVDSHHGNKPEGIYGWQGYVKYDPKQHKKEKDLVKKGIFIEGSRRGKMIDILLNEDIKAEGKKAVAADPVKNEASVKQKVELANAEIEEIRDRKLREVLCAEILKQDLSKEILIPIVREFVSWFGNSVELELDSRWDDKKARSAKVEEVIDRFNRGAIKSMQSGGYEICVIISICMILKIDYPAHEIKINDEFPLVTAADIKKKQKEGKKTEAAEDK